MGCSYDISILIPIYNAADYLDETLNSILNQEIGDIKYEVLLIDDGSVDNSKQICLNYTRKFDHFKYSYKENSGVSDTRNFGMTIAQGEYILFLDADDLLGEGTIRGVYQTFEKYKNKANILAYPLYTKNKNKITAHARNENYCAEGVFHIKNFPFLNQCTMNTVVKNLPEDKKIYFDTSLAQSEDALFNSQMIMTTGSIIISNRGKYIYRTEHASTVDKYKNPVEIKDMILCFFEKLIATTKNSEDQIPIYIQSMILYEINWRFKQHTFFPYHLDRKAFDRWMGRLKQVFCHIDVKTILNQPFMDFYHRIYFIREFKANIYTSIDSTGIYHYCEKENIVKVNSFTLVFNKIKLVDNQIKILGYLKAPLLEKVEGLKIKVSDSRGREFYLDLNDSPEDYYKAKIPVATFLNFDFSLSLSENAEYIFRVEVDGYEYPTKKYFEDMVIFKHYIGSRFVVTKNKVIEYKDSPFSIKITDRKQQKKQAKEIIKHQKKLIGQKDMKSLSHFSMFKKFLAPFLEKRKIWLYNDRVGLFDNAYEQFSHDIQKTDHVKRYYVLRKEDRNSPMIPKKNKVIYGSLKHKILFYYSSLIITSFKDKIEYSPISNRALNLFYSELSAKIIYIQHGVLNAYTPWLYSKNKTGFDKILISTHLEKEWLKKKYGYKREDLVESGMPRFDVTSSQKKSKKILLAPSWRKSLVKEDGNLARSIDETTFKSSDFYKEISRFINSDRLGYLLKQHGYTLDVKMHPIFGEQGEFFQSKFDNVHILDRQEQIDNSEYSLFITDFSSYLFDFIKAKTKIICFFPDYDCFLSGNHIYNQLHLDLKCFGGILKEHDQLIAEMEQCIQTDFSLSQEMKQMYEHFYFEPESGTYVEDLYKALCKESNVMYKKEAYLRSMIDLLKQIASLPSEEKAKLIDEIEDNYPELLNEMKGTFK
ncbi:glycosyltransferase [Listeria ilorinensis]|uniref:glycosyltransferase n=1 Tax=Listeria ilorinensis TaxID=2867439 RepID=UPI001EF5D5D2|nr:glycosyltransferase [Listeria ilorinensis]